jgi:hypothetical protein
MKVNLSNSIYQQKKAGPGLSVECGMLINNRPNSTTGIQKAAEMRKIMKKMEKISTISEAVAMGGVNNCPHCMG